MNKQAKTLIGVGAAVAIGALLLSRMGNAQEAIPDIVTGDLENLGLATSSDGLILLDLPQFTYTVTEIVNGGIERGEISYDPQNRTLDAVAIDAYVVARLPDHGLDYLKMRDEDKDQAGEALRDVLKHYFDAADDQGLPVDSVRLADWIRDHHERALDENGMMAWDPTRQDYSELTQI